MKFYRTFNTVYFRSKDATPNLFLNLCSCLNLTVCHLYYTLPKQCFLPKVQLEYWTSAFRIVLQKSLNYMIRITLLWLDVIVIYHTNWTSPFEIR